VASLSQGRTAAAQCGLFTHKSVPVIFEPPCTNKWALLTFITVVRNILKKSNWSIELQPSVGCVPANLQ